MPSYWLAQRINMEMLNICCRQVNHPTLIYYEFMHLNGGVRLNFVLGSILL